MRRKNSWSDILALGLDSASFAEAIALASWCWLLSLGRPVFFPPGEVLLRILCLCCQCTWGFGAHAADGMQHTSTGVLLHAAGLDAGLLLVEKRMQLQNVRKAEGGI